jgi:hypothetical protein
MTDLKNVIVITAFCSLMLGFFTMFITKAYLNKSKRRQRLIELIWGVDNEYFRGKKFDFVMANYVIAGCIFTAWRMKKGYVTKTQKAIGSYGYPMLHTNQNYNKLLIEFSFFAYWETLKIMFTLIFFLSGGFVYGVDNGWW